MAKMVNAIFAYQKTGGVNNSGNLTFIMFALYLPLSICLRHIICKELVCATSCYL